MVDEKRTHQATLGCGTLILIALIVLFFSRPGLGDLERDVRALRSEVGVVKKAVQAQTNEIKEMREKLNKLQPGKAAGGKGNEWMGREPPNQEGEPQLNTAGSPRSVTAYPSREAR